MTSVDRVLEVYTKLRGVERGEPLDVIVLRKGAAITLTYQLT